MGHFLFDNFWGSARVRMKFSIDKAVYVENSDIFVSSIFLKHLKMAKQKGIAQ